MLKRMQIPVPMGLSKALEIWKGVGFLDFFFVKT